MILSILRCVRPHAHGSEMMRVMSRVRVAHQRAALARQRGEHQFAVLAVGNRLKRSRVYDGEEMVLGQVQAAHFLALERHARAHDFGQAVHVAILDAQLLGDFLAHALAAGLGAEMLVCSFRSVAGFMPISMHVSAISRA